MYGFPGRLPPRTLSLTPHQNCSFMRQLLSALIVIACFSRANAQATETVKVTDLLQLKTAGNIVASHDGNLVAFTVTSIEKDETTKNDYRYVTQIHIARAENHFKPYQLTFGKEGASQPAWSPDGTTLAFVRPVDGKPQIFLLPLNGGEPRQLTKYKYGAASPAWSPAGDKLLFIASVSLNDLVKDSSFGNAVPAWPMEVPGLADNTRLRNNAKPNPNGSMDEVRAYMELNATDKKAIVLDKLNFQNETGISSEQAFSQLFLVKVDEPDKVTRISQGFYRYGNAAFTPTGTEIIFTSDIDSLQHPDRSQESQVFLCDLTGHITKTLLSAAGKGYGNATLSHSGKWLAFSVSAVNHVGISKLGIIPFPNGSKDTTYIPLDRDASGIAWMGDDDLFFTAQTNGGIVLYRYHLADKSLTALSSEDEGVNAFDIAGNNILYTKTTTLNPSEVYVSDISLKNEKTITKLNDWVNFRKISLPEEHSFTNSQGMKVEYWVMKPIGFQPGKKYPLLLEIHGGPSAMWGPGVLSMWHEYQFFCSKGYGVVYCNPRGSGGYGEKFMRANIKDWGNGPAADVLTSLDKAVAEGWADTSKLLITGGSYAGYLTAWIIAHDHRFKAACSQRGVYDLATFFGEGNAWRLVPNYFGGYPWQPAVKELLVRESPITYVQNITTPYIIFHGGSDRRTGFVQGEMMYRSLKVLNRPVEYVVHPGASHEITRSGDNRQRIDQMLRTWEFFERWIGGNK